MADDNRGESESVSLNHAREQTLEADVSCIRDGFMRM